MEHEYRNGIYHLIPHETPHVLNCLLAKGPQIHVIDTFANLQLASSQDIFYEFAQSFSFPEYYGYSLDALLDCLVELEGDHVLIIGVRQDMHDLFVPVFEILSKACVWHTSRNRRFDVFATTFPVPLSNPRL